MITPPSTMSSTVLTRSGPSSQTPTIAVATRPGEHRGADRHPCLHQERPGETLLDLDGAALRHLYDSSSLDRHACVPVPAHPDHDSTRNHRQTTAVTQHVGLLGRPIGLRPCGRSAPSTRPARTPARRRWPSSPSGRARDTRRASASGGTPSWRAPAARERSR